MQNKGADDFQTALEMKSQNFLTSACRYCRYYQPEGRRGGMCQQLGVQVQGSWKACALALPPFARSWSEKPCSKVARGIGENWVDAFPETPVSLQLLLQSCSRVKWHSQPVPVDRLDHHSQR